MSPMRPRFLCPRAQSDLEVEMAQIGVDQDSIEVMAPKGLVGAVKLYDVPAEQARRLKSFALQLGADSAISADVYFSRNGPSNVLVLGSLSQLMRLSLTLRATRSAEAALADQLDRALASFSDDRGTTRCGTLTLDWGTRTYVMGILNVTPDSFSGDGLGTDLGAVIEQARQFIADGVDILDVGGESTRPGHTPVSVDEELARVVPVVSALAQEFTTPISVDTYKAEVAHQAVRAGASMINDVWGLRHDPDMARVVAEAGVPVVVMHNQHGTKYQNLMDGVLAGLGQSIDIALEAGVKWENIIVDPGFGFGKNWHQNLEVLARLAELKSLGRPILIGTSRKSTIGKVLGLTADERVEGTAATVAIGIQNGADIVRVHDVREMARVCRMTDAIVRQQWHESSLD